MQRGGDPHLVLAVEREPGRGLGALGRGRTMA